MNKTKASVIEKDDYLIVTEVGERTSLQEIVKDVKTVYEAAKGYDKRYILADFSRVNNAVPLTDAFNIVKIFENKFPELSQLTISYVANENNLNLIKFWEYVSNQRGFEIKVFTDFDEAEEWLLSVK